jgi:hypothetical protein
LKVQLVFVGVDAEATPDRLTAMTAMTAIAETPATASRRLCVRADVGSAADADGTLSVGGWGLILVIMMCSFDVIGVLVGPLTQVGAPSPAKDDTFSRIDL